MNWKESWKHLQQGAYLMVGLPDYEGYVAHRQQHHPNEQILSRNEFLREAQNRRYAGKGNNRCC